VYAKWCRAEDRDPFAATSLDIEDYLRELHEERDYGYSTVNVHLAALSHFFDAADTLAENGRAVPSPQERSPVNRWENPTDDARLANVVANKEDRKYSKKERALAETGDRHGLNREQVDAVLEAVPSPTLRNATMLRLGYQAMLRRTEVARLKVDDIDWNDHSITVRPEVSKNGESRTTYFQPSLTTSLKSWIDVDREGYALASDSEYVFLSHERERLTDFHVGDVFRQASLEANIGQEVLYTDARGHDKLKYSFHSLRHAGAVRRWENDCDLRTLQKLLGHESISTTETYLDVEDEALAQKAKATW
jgi:integrase/recombinase XerD